MPESPDLTAAQIMLLEAIGRLSGPGKTVQAIATEAGLPASEAGRELRRLEQEHKPPLLQRYTDEALGMQVWSKTPAGNDALES